MVVICLNTWSSFKPEHLQLLQSITVTDTPWVSGHRDHHLQQTMQFLWGSLHHVIGSGQKQSSHFEAEK